MIRIQLYAFCQRISGSLKITGIGISQALDEVCVPIFAVMTYDLIKIGKSDFRRTYATEKLRAAHERIIGIETHRRIRTEKIIQHHDPSLVSAAPYIREILRRITARVCPDKPQVIRYVRIGCTLLRIFE